MLGFRNEMFRINWERGISTPPPKTAKKLAAMYDLNLEEFLDLLLKDTLQQVTIDFKKKVKNLI
jgi:hypothetical protein